MNDKTAHEHVNRLINETSPYLLQHAHNPVDWYPWSDEALERARREDKLILLSIGYSACHWCHVMERESFENEDIAALMNRDFVNIKVDREERPDLDEIYMAATVALNQGQGGWPMTVFLTPDLEPVFAGTYFPPNDMLGRPGFPTILRKVAQAWREDREGLRQRASEFTATLKRRQSLGPGFAVGETELRQALETFRQEFDPEFGGFGSAPKFPPAVGLSLLLRLHRRFDSPQALGMVRTTLEAMARGGIYDHIGGGFARYSTDRRWLIPHFEKMLYDNALLARAYLEGHQVAREPLFRRVAVETLDYVLRDMTAPDGGFYSSTDADSEGEEGKFFVWTPEGIAAVLSEEDARRFNAYYDITPGGNWERGVSVPHTPEPLSAVAQRLDIPPDDLQESLETARAQVYAAREKRVKPGLDDKILTAWNGLMIGALAEGYRLLRNERYLSAAERAADFVLNQMSTDDSGLFRTYRDARAHTKAVLEDYAYLGEGLIDLYEASGSERWLHEAHRLADYMLANFQDEDTGAFYHTSADHETLVMRYREGADGATPAANAVAASTLARLSHHLDQPPLRHAAIAAIKAYGPSISRYPRGFAKSLCVVDFLLEGPIELAFVGRKGAGDLEALQRAVAEHYLPNRIQAISFPDAGAAVESLPLLHGKTLVDGQAALYICRDYTCRAPITRPEGVAQALQDSPPATQHRTSIAVHAPGRATPEGTTRLTKRFPEQRFAALGSTGIAVSRLGFGGYRIHERSDQHREALQHALRSGVNLIDTSTNYLDGASERLVGSVVRHLTDEGELTREEIVLISKIGYLQGSNLERARERERGNEPYPEIVKYDDELWHCIHPTFLADQLQRSLDRLELETLDICLLHNPEYFLSDAARAGQPLDRAREEFYRRLTDSFAYLEDQVAAGRLGGYGVSSNSAVLPAANPTATSLSRMLDAARAAAGEGHHFLAIQVPLNLLEPGAVLVRNTGPDNRQTVLEAAEAADVAVFVNRPLNAVLDGALLRLADATPEEPVISFDESLSRLADLEMAFHAELAPALHTEGEALDVDDFFRMAEQLRAIQANLVGLAQWSQLEAQINYSLGSLIMALDRAIGGQFAERWTDWRDSYLGELQDLMRELRRQAAEKSHARSHALSIAIAPELPEERGDETLSRKALWTVASTSAVTCVLNGMRQVDYVNDSVEILTWPPLERPTDVYRAAQDVRSQLFS